MAVLFAVLYASVILPIVASRRHPPVLLYPVVEPYRVVKSSAATIQCTFGFPGSIFRVYRNAGETLVETKNFTITERQEIGTALSVKATVKGLPVGVNNIILRTLTKQGNHADCNEEVEVLPTSAIPQLMIVRLDSGSLPRYHMGCIVTHGTHMLPGIVTFEHFVNEAKIHSSSKAYYSYNSGTIKDDILVWSFEGQYLCIAKVWLSTNQSSCTQRPWVLSATFGTRPRSIPPRPSFFATTTAVDTKTETVLETSTVSQTYPDSRANVEWITPVNRSWDPLTGSCLKTSMVTDTVLETATVLQTWCPDSKGNVEWITLTNCSSTPLTGSCLKTSMVTETVLETATVSQTQCPDSKGNVEWITLTNCSSTPLTGSCLEMNIIIIIGLILILGSRE